MANRKKKDEALAAVQAQTEGSGQPAAVSYTHLTLPTTPYV